MQARGLGRALALALLLAASLMGGRSAQSDDDPAEPTEVPVRVTAEVDAREAGEMALWRVRLVTTVEEDVGRPYRVKLILTYQGRTLLDLSHAPRTPTASWRKGQKVAYEMPVPVPQEADVPAGAEVELRLGFFDPAADRVLPFRSDDTPRAGLLTIAVLVLPEMQPTDAEDVAARIVARAEELTRTGLLSDAWRLLETALRRAVEDGTKRRFRDALMRLGSLTADPPSALEEEIVAARIAAERVRYLREESGRQFDRGRLFAALRLLEEVGGSLEEQRGAAVLGALGDAQRAQKDLDDLRVRILGKVTDVEKEEAQALIAKHGGTAALLKEARALAAAKQYATARILLRTLALGGDQALATEARAAQEQLERAWLGDTPPEEAQAVEAARQHPAFARLTTVPSHKFLFIGPRTLVEGIPPESRLRYDLAHVFLTDLFGRSPNPSGDRITVYYKELWDFGGGQAGGKTIDIGRADPTAKTTRVDTGLLYHELTHCVDDTDPIYAGFREGLANFGAAYLFEMLGQDGDTAHAFASNLEAFRRDYLGRDLAYWRIQDYGPSAGFFLHFADKYTRVPGGHDWRPYRRFFRAYRRAPSGDGREPYIARALAHYLVESFGAGAFDDLLAFRFPLEESDRQALPLEAELLAKGESELARRAEEFARHPNSPVTRDLLARHMLAQAGGSGHAEAVREVGRRLGVIYDWQVIGPFRSPGADPRARVFPPEEEIDLARQYEDGLNSCRWRRAGPEGAVVIDPYGWVSLNFSYQDDTASYGLTWLTVDQEQPALVHLRADDDVTLFLNDRRVESYVRRAETGWQPWYRGPRAPMPDAMRLPVVLKQGRNKLLLKLKNRAGPAGFVLALSRRDGLAIEGLRVDADASGPSTVSAPTKPSWRDVFDQAFRAKKVEGHFDVAVGRFKVANKRLIGEATDGQVSWRRYSVRPGYPTDAPSNLLWLKPKATEGLTDFRLRLDLVPPAGQAPKIAVTFQGDGGTDGLAGWTLIVHPDGDKQVAARLERYEDLHYQVPPQPLPVVAKDVEELPLLLTFNDGRLTVTLGDLVLLRSVSLLAIPGRQRIGFSTWGPETSVAGVELEQPAAAR